MSGSLSNEASSRQQGLKSFIVKYGILGWGIPVALAVTVWDWISGTPVTDLAVPLAIRLVLFGLLGGIAFGAFMWKFSQWQRAKAQKHVS
jgi:hypothetical protein